MRKALLLFVLLCASCAQINVGGASKPVVAVAQAGPDAPYITLADIDLPRLLPPPPATGSDEQKAEIKLLLDTQKARSAERFKIAQADQKASILRVGEVLGPDLTEDKLPVTMKFFANVGRSVGPLILVAKNCYERPRPFVADARIKPAEDFLKSTAGRVVALGTATPPTPQGPDSPCLPPAPEAKYSFSYPSGHSEFGAMTAILLAQMVPEKRAALYARGWDYGQSRIVGGVHYPSDVAAGRIEATAIVAVMMKNPQFKADLAAARAETRGALGLSP